MAQPTQGPSDPLGSITFRSLLPMVDSLLSILHGQSTAGNPASTIEASEQVAAKARELATALEEMRTAAVNLPGGELSIQQINEMSRYLDGEAASRRAILSRFGEMDMPVVEDLGQRATRAVTGEESLATPAVE